MSAPTRRPAICYIFYRKDYLRTCRLPRNLRNLQPNTKWQQTEATWSADTNTGP